MNAIHRRSASRAAPALVTVLLAAMLIPAVAFVPTAAVADGAPTRLLVTYDEPVDARTVAADLDTVTLAADAYVATTAGRSGAAAARPSPVQVVEVADAAAAERLAPRLEGRDGVAAVERDSRLRIDPPTASATAAPLGPGASAGATALGPAATTGTARLATVAEPPPMWGIDNTGELIDGASGKRGVDIGARQAWPTATGRDVVVAVIDTGVDIDHPLLRDRIWRNPDELDDRRDTDGNGYVDDVHGWNFADGTSQVSMSPELDLHGTHVAGVIVGEHHEASGFRGVAPDARIMPLPFVDQLGAGWTADAVLAIRYAVDNGADVINASWTGAEGSHALRTVIEDAGIPVVAAAGNTGEPHERRPVYPAAFGLDNLLSVAAVDHTGAMAPFSSTSRNTVDLAAPGTSILSAAPDHRLASLSGTSMAAPFVAGAVALTIEADPDASAVEVVDAVRSGVRPLAGVAETATGGIARAGGAIAAVGGRVPICHAEPRSPFDDVPGDHTHFLGVACLSTLGITSGVSDDRYGAELDLRRDQVAALVARALERGELLADAPPDARFDDLDGNVHAERIEALAAIGVVEGESDTRFGPGTVVSRGEFAGIVARAAEHAAGATSRLTGSGFDDIADSPHRQGITTASALSLVAGRGEGIFDPDGDVRRDQAATMLVHLLDRLYQQGLLAPA